MHYDVVVMGAGPGGCMTALDLTDAGFKVLLLEKERLPREKVCGGFLPPEAVEIIEEGFGSIPGDCLVSPDEVRGGRLLVEGGGAYDLPFRGPGRSVSRSHLDAFMARRCGAEVRDGWQVEDFKMERFHVSARISGEGEEELVESTYLVGADGADSLALSQLRPEFHRLYALPGLERTMLVISQGEIDWDPQWLGLVLMKKGRGFARFFVRDDMIGMAVNYDQDKGWMREYEDLTVFLREGAGFRPEGEALRRPSSSNRMGVAGKYNLGAGCSLLVGEAAGLLDPWGFGIRLALESGRVAAESLVESAGESITPHLRYRYRMQEVLERLQREKRDLSSGVGDLDTTSLAAEASREARKDRRLVRRRFSK